MKTRSASTAKPLEPFEIRPLLQLGRAAMSSKDHSPDALTHEGMIMLLNIIDDLLFPNQEDQDPPKEGEK